MHKMSVSMNYVNKPVCFCFDTITCFHLADAFNQNHLQRKSISRQLYISKPCLQDILLRIKAKNKHFLNHKIWMIAMKNSEIQSISKA